MSNLKIRIEQANHEAVQRMLDSQPVWTDVKKAIDVCPGLKKNMIMHAGPPITWSNMASSQKVAVRGAIIYEQWAKTMEEADHLVASGGVELSPCHEHNTVGPMCGVTSPSMPVLVVRNLTFGNEAYIYVYERLDSQRLTFGSFGTEVMESLKWRDQVAAPVLKALVSKTGPIDLRRIIARALTMGDELHNRNFAATAIFALEVMPTLVELDFDRNTISEIANWIKRTEQFFLHFSMASAKVTADAANGIEHSTVVTAIARNGVDVGIRLSSMPHRWFVGPAGPIEGLFFANYTPDDAERDLGDSAIMETTGLGAFAHAAAPLLALTKGNVEMASRYTNEMQQICVGNNPNYGIPALAGKGAPIAIDIRKVLDTKIVPVINTGITHKKGGKIGTGNSRVPMECFKQAIQAFRKQYTD